MSHPGSTLLRTAHGVDLECLSTGSGKPVTVFAHGLAGTIAETRPLASAVQGTRVFLSFRGHGASSSPETGWSYADLAADVTAVADAYGATRAVGISMGAGALCRTVAMTPGRFERLVFVLPAVVDQPRRTAASARLEALADAVESRDAGRVAALVEDDVPADFRGTAGARAFVRQRSEGLRSAGVVTALRALPGQVALPPEAGGIAALREVRAPALVLGSRDDVLHPAAVAERLASALPSAELHVYPQGAMLWTARRDLRRRISGFLNR